MEAKIWKVIRYGTKWRNLCNNCVAKIYRKSIIQIPGQKNAKNELEKIQAIGKERMKHMKETEQRIIQKWIECLEDNASLEAQQAYCQGYIDCLFLLCGMGIIEKDSVANDIFEQLNK